MPRRRRSTKRRSTKRRSTTKVKSRVKSAKRKTAIGIDRFKVRHYKGRFGPD